MSGPDRLTTVQHTATHVAIIATGPSLKGVTLHIPEGATVITVNDAIHHVPRSDFWFTTDFAYRNQETMANPRPGTVYYAAIWLPYLEWFGLRDKVGHVRFLERVDGKDFPVGYEKAKPGLSDDPGRIHAGNSAWGALQLAWLMGAKCIALLGVDGRQEDGYAWGPGRPKGSLAHLPYLFASAVPQFVRRGVSVVNGSPHSAVSCFARCRPDEALHWLGVRARQAA